MNNRTEFILNLKNPVRTFFEQDVDVFGIYKMFKKCLQILMCAWLP